ncbi:MAG TPA: ZIP family metal transporter [Longimicrobiales bacterium]
MSSDFLTIALIAGGAAAASMLGGLIALWHRPTTLFMSIVLGFASGVLLAAIGFDMLPQALGLAGLPLAVAGFAAGFIAVYGFDLFIYRGHLAGERSEQRPQVERFYQRRPPHGGEVTVLAGGTSAEELIEGLSIGVGVTIKPGLGLLIAIAIAIDNISEGLSIGEIIRAGTARHERPYTRRVLGWTGLIAVALLASALAGWFLLRGVSEPLLGFLFAVGAGGMFYLTITDLIPDAEERQYQQSAAIAMGAGFMTIFVLSSFH